MRYLVLTDIHANLEALEAVLADAGAVDAVLFLGDLIGYGPNPNEVVARLKGLANLTALSGNHDWAALGKLDLDSFNDVARAAAEWTTAHLEPEIRSYLDALPPRLDIDGFTLAHGSPRNPIWEYLEHSSQGPPNFAAFEAPVAFVGHTHVPRILAQASGDHNSSTRVEMPHSGQVINLREGGRRIVNPGGVGQPRDGDSRAAYGLWDSETGTFTFRRVPYDVARTQEKILAAGLPPMLAARLSYGL